MSCHGEGNNRTHLYGHNDEHVTWTLAINCILSHTSSFRNRPLSRLLDVAPGYSCLLLWVECVQMVPLAGVSAAHRFQVSRACLSMFTRSRSSLPIWLLPTGCLFQPSTTSFIVIIAATDSTNTTRNCRRSSFSSRWKGSRLWNGLPHVVTSASTLAVFWKRLKTYLFSRSFTL